MPTWRTARSATCSCRPKSCPSSRRSSARGARVHPGSRSPWMFHLLAAPGATAGEPSLRNRPRPVHRARSNGGQPAGAGRATGRRPCRTPRARCSIRSWRSAAPSTCHPTRSATVQIISGVADTREAALALLDKYCDRHFVERAFEMAWFQSQEVLRHLNATEADAQVYGRLAGSVIYGNALRRAAPGIIARNQLDAVGAVALRHLGRSADRAAAHRRHQPHRHTSSRCCRPTRTGA